MEIRVMDYPYAVELDGYNLEQWSSSEVVSSSQSSSRQTTWRSNGRSNRRSSRR